jgi:hypothetical protein
MQTGRYSWIVLPALLASWCCWQELHRLWAASCRPCQLRPQSYTTTEWRATQSSRSCLSVGQQHFCVQPDRGVGAQPLALECTVLSLLLHVLSCLRSSSTYLQTVTKGVEAYSVVALAAYMLRVDDGAMQLQGPEGMSCMYSI